MQTIGYFDDSAGPSGTTQYLLELLNALDRAKYRAVVFSPHPALWHRSIHELGMTVVTWPDRRAGGDLREALGGHIPRAGDIDAGTAPAWDIEYSRQRAGLRTSARQTLSWFRGLQAEMASLTELFRRNPVDLIHSNNVGDEVAPIAARRSGTRRVIGTIHTEPNTDIFNRRGGPQHRWLQRRSFRALDLAIAVSQHTRFAWQKHLAIGPEARPRFEVVYNGIRLDRLTRRRTIAEAKAALGIPADTLVIGSLGRLDWAKGYSDLMAALPAVLAAVPDTMFVHAGTGRLAANLAADAERMGISGHVRWLGFLADVRDLLEVTDLYTQPSWCEAHTLSVLEAGALELPVVATDVGGHAETLADDAGGWIVPARQPDELSRALVAALRDPGARRSRGAWFGQRVRTCFTNEIMVGKTMALYEELFASARTTS